MKVISVGSDRKLFEEGSSVSSRAIRYRSLFDELHIIVFSHRRHMLKRKQISSNVWVYPTNSQFKLLYPLDAVLIAKKISADVVTAQDPFEAGLAGFIISRKKGIKFHIQVHTDFLSPFFPRYSLKNRLRILLAKYILPKAGCIRVVSKRIFNSLAELKLKDYLSKTVVLPIYTDRKLFDSAGVTSNLRKKYSQFTFTILMVSRLEKEKNISLAVDVLKEVVKKYPKTGLVIVGEGTERVRLSQKAKQNGISDHVFFEGWQPSLSSYYQSAHVFLLTSFYEGYGNTLVEAALASCPIVSSDVGIVGDVLKDEEHILICPVGNAECFVAKISRLIEDNQLRSSLSRNAKEQVLESLDSSWDNYLARYKKSLEMCS